MEGTAVPLWNLVVWLFSHRKLILLQNKEIEEISDQMSTNLFFHILHIFPQIFISSIDKGGDDTQISGLAFRITPPPAEMFLRPDFQGEGLVIRRSQVEFLRRIIAEQIDDKG